MLCIWQNRDGESLEAVRRTDVPTKRAAQEQQEALLEGMIFDDVQALEGYLESISSCGGALPGAGNRHNIAASTAAANRKRSGDFSASSNKTLISF